MNRDNRISPLALENGDVVLASDLVRRLEADRSRSSAGGAIEEGKEGKEEKEGQVQGDDQPMVPCTDRNKRDSTLPFVRGSGIYLLLSEHRLRNGSIASDGIVEVSIAPSTHDHDWLV